MACDEGAEVLIGGHRAPVEPQLAGGYYFEPTVLKGHNKMRVFQEEIFGPVLAVTTFKDEAEALEIANDTMYGLGAGVWTRDGSRAFRMGRAIKAGRVWTNCYHQYPAHAAFGGYKSLRRGTREPSHDARPLQPDQVPARLIRPEPARVLLDMPRDGGETDTAIAATPAALEVIHRLSAAQGPLMFFQSGGCCDGSSPMCLKEGELPLSPQDVRLGEIAGMPFYIDSDQLRALGTAPHHGRRLTGSGRRVLARRARGGSLRNAVTAVIALVVPPRRLRCPRAVFPADLGGEVRMPRRAPRTYDARQQ